MGTILELLLEQVALAIKQNIENVYLNHFRFNQKSGTIRTIGAKDLLRLNLAQLWELFKLCKAFLRVVLGLMSLDWQSGRKNGGELGTTRKTRNFKEKLEAMRTH